MIYVSYSNLSKAGLIGVKKKISAQCYAFEKVFGKAYYTTVAGQTIYLMHDQKVIDKRNALSKKEFNDAVIQWITELKITKAYIRYSFSDIWFIDFLRELKSLEVRFVLEFPTIPYDGEGGINKKAEDQYYREQLHQYVDYCTTYSKYKTVFHIPCIPLVNGVNIKNCNIDKLKNKRDIVLIAVATMRREHGYERIIKGLFHYYKSGPERKIYFDLVGQGAQIPYYKQLTSEYGLEDYVRFCGLLEGTELDKIYRRADLGVGPLGMYKSGINAGVGIKAAEYCANGLPMLMTDDYGFEEQYFLLKVPNDASPVNIHDVIAFYDSLQRKDYISDMRKYVVENFSWDRILEPVICYLNGQR